MLKRSLFFLSGFTLVLLLAAGCTTTTTTTSGGGEIGIRAGVYSYLGTQSPGDVWDWTIGEGTFIGTNETQSKYYSGTFKAYASGFNKATIKATNDPGVPTDGTGTAYFLEYPDTMLIVKPGDNNLIICAASAATAPSAGQYNFVNIPWPGWTSASNAYGTVEVSVSGGLYSFNVANYSLAGSLVDTNSASGFSFSGGKLVKAGEELQIFMTPSGCFMGDNGAGKGGFAGAARQTIDTAAVAGKEFRGVLFSYDTASREGEIQAIGAGPNPGVPGTLFGYSFTDIENNIKDTKGVTLEFSAALGNGIIQGIMRHNNGTSDYFNMVIAQVGGKYIVLGIATDGRGRPQNFLVVEK